jgi:serine protease Do
LPTAVAAENAQRPVGFADLVEKVKPAVISVRVKMDAGTKMMGFEPFSPNSQMEQFFRRFGMPYGDSTPDGGPRMPHNRSVTGQGSGFFITAASEHGFKTGDVILDVGGKKVTTPADVRNAISDAQKNGKRTVLMRLKSDDATKFVAIPIARA